MRDPLRFHKNINHATFSNDTFGKMAEHFARLFGTPNFIIGQTLLIIVWVLVNGVLLLHGWDPYPFILLNLAFSTQAAYAAPLILLAQTRQADRDKEIAEAAARHHEELATEQREILDLIHDKVREDTPGGLRVVIEKLDQLLKR